MKEYNGVIRIYDGHAENNDVIAEIGFTLNNIEDVVQFSQRAIQTLTGYKANPDYLRRTDI